MHVIFLPAVNNFLGRGLGVGVGGLRREYLYDHPARVHRAMVTGARWARVGAVLDIFLQGLKRISVFVFERREVGSSRQLSLAPG